MVRCSVFTILALTSACGSVHPNTDAAIASDVAAHDASSAADASTVAIDAAPGCVSMPPGLLAWWTGDGVFSDRTGSYNLNVVGATTDATFVDARVMKGLRLANSTFVLSDVLSPPRQFNALTVEGWFKADANVGSLVAGNIQGTTGWRMFYDATGRLGFRIGADQIFATAPAVGTLAHLAATWDGAELRLFVNGISVAPAVPHSASQTVDFLRLGAANGSSALYHGLVDEVVVHSRALTVEELASIANAGALGYCKS